MPRGPQQTHARELKQRKQQPLKQRGLQQRRPKQRKLRQTELLAASLVQCLKALHQVVLDNGSCSNATLLLPWSEKPGNPPKAREACKETAQIEFRQCPDRRNGELIEHRYLNRRAEE